MSNKGGEVDKPLGCYRCDRDGTIDPIVLVRVVKLRPSLVSASGQAEDADLMCLRCIGEHA